jgi:hypothetical protein
MQMEDIVSGKRIRMTGPTLVELELDYDNATYMFMRGVVIDGDKEHTAQALAEFQRATRAYCQEKYKDRINSKLS